jgi:NADH dehydrogenase FAD-containing subunit
MARIHLTISEKMEVKKHRVLIIGGGFAGCKVAKLLSAESTLKVSIIDPKEYLEVTWVNPRSLVTPEWAQRSLIPFSTFLTDVEFIRDEVTALETNCAVTKSGQRVQFDYCVIAVGSSYAGFMKPAPATSTAAQRLSEMHAHSEQLKAAAHVLIVGGGASGVELAFEILDVYPSKKVTVAWVPGSKVLCIQP